MAFNHLQPTSGGLQPNSEPGDTFVQLAGD